MRVVVTRPAPEAQRWVAQLQARGIDALALPLLEIRPGPEAGRVQAARQGLAAYAAVMFVSANAVQAFFACTPALAWPAPRPRAWAPGPGTQAALVAAGVPATSIDAPAAAAAQFDSESLWARVQGQLAAGERLLLVRGAGADGRGQGREWLSQQLAAAGVQVEPLAAYARALPAWTTQQRQQARAAAADACWLFSSSEAAANLRRLLPAQDFSGARAIATHPRIAAAVRALGFRSVRESRPAFDDVMASIESAQ